MYNFKDFIKDIEKQLSLYLNSLSSIDTNILTNIHMLMVEPVQSEDIRTALYNMYFNSGNLTNRNYIDETLTALNDSDMLLSKSITDIRVTNNIAESIACLHLISIYKPYEQYKEIMRNLYSRMYELFVKENPHNVSLASILDGANNKLYDEYIMDIGSDEFSLLFFNKKIIKLWKRYRQEMVELPTYIQNEIAINGILQMSNIEEEFQDELIQIQLADAMYVNENLETYIAISVYDNDEDYAYVHPYANRYLQFTQLMRDKFSYESNRAFSTYSSLINSRPITVSLNEYLKSSKYGQILTIDLSTTSRELLLTAPTDENILEKWKILSYGYLRPIA